MIKFQKYFMYGNVKMKIKIFKNVMENKSFVNVLLKFIPPLA